MDNEEKLAIIGDVHGDLENLVKLFSTPELTSFQGRFIFLGDLINRGIHSKEVIDFVLDLKNTKVVTVLKGNHEYYFLSYLMGQMDFSDFAEVGGINTIVSYLSKAKSDVRRELIKKIPSDHIKLLLDSELYFENDSLLVSHMGINPQVPDSRSIQDMVLNSHPEIFGINNHFTKKIICGHYKQENFTPYTSDDVVCIDTGAGIGGRLTAFLWPDEKYVFSTKRIVPFAD